MDSNYYGWPKYMKVLNKFVKINISSVPRTFRFAYSARLLQLHSLMLARILYNCRGKARIVRQKPAS